MIDAFWVLSVSALIFTIGLLTLVLRRNILVMLMGIELMLNAANLSFVTFSKMNQSLQGEITTLFVVVVAAVESAVGLALLIALFRTLKTTDTADIKLLRE